MTPTTPKFAPDDTGRSRINGGSGDVPGSTCVKHGDQTAAHGIVDLRHARTVSSDTDSYRVPDLLWGTSDKQRDALADAGAMFGDGGTPYHPTVRLKVTKLRSNEVLYVHKPNVVGRASTTELSSRAAMLTGQGR